MFPASALHFRCLPGLLHCPLHPHLSAGLAYPDLRHLYQKSGRLLYLYFHRPDLLPLQHLWMFPASALHFSCLSGRLHCPFHPDLLVFPHLPAGLVCPDLRYLYQKSGHPLPVSDPPLLPFPSVRMRSHNLLPH